MQLLTSQDFWSILSSIASVLGFTVVIWTAFMALGQLKEMARSRHLEAMLQVYEMIGSDQARADRRFIYVKLKSIPASLTAEEWEYVEKVSAVFDRIGNLASHGLIPEEEFFQSHCEIIIKAWMKLEPYIMYRRRVYGGRFANQFEQLSKDACKYHAKHFPGNKIEVINHSINESVMPQTESLNNARLANGKEFVARHKKEKLKPQHKTKA